MKFKFMNRTTKLITTMLLAVVVMSCEDFLEPKSLSNFDASYVYSNIDDARLGVNAIYTQFQVDGFRSRLSNNMTGNTDIEWSAGYDNKDNGRREIWNLDAQTSNGDLRQFWEAAYTAIRNCNISIEGILASEILNSDDKATSNAMYHLLGEAYTLRAYWYSMLIYYFGDVPFVSEAPKPTAEFYIPRTDRNEILEVLIQDLIDIEEKMKWSDQTQFGIEQVNREYALGMIARLALQRGGYYLTPSLTMEREGSYLDYYQIAREYSKKLIMLKDQALPSNYAQMFTNENTFVTDPSSTDVLFEVPFALGNGDVAWNIGIDVHGGPLAKHNFGSGGNYMNMPATYYVSFDTTDIRRDITCGLHYINLSGIAMYIGEDIEDNDNGGGAQGISQGKWSRYLLPNAPGALSAKGTGINWPMMRYPDVLLMFAEAENELNGPTAEAQDALAKVRRRAFPESLWSEKVDTYITNASAGSDAFFEAIVDERAWEFGGEMQRKYELIRWNKYYDKIQATVDGLKALSDYATNGVPLDPNNRLFRFNTTPPDYFYWRSLGNEIEIYNRNSKLLINPDENIWNQDGFLVDLYDSELETYDEWIIRTWENYLSPPWGSTGAIRYVFPIPAETISNSQGTISNSEDPNNYPEAGSYYSFGL
jgi:hypothetical protein